MPLRRMAAGRGASLAIFLFAFWVYFSSSRFPHGSGFGFGFAFAESSSSIAATSAVGVNIKKSNDRIASNIVLVGELDGTMSALDDTGRLLWRTGLGGALISHGIDPSQNLIIPGHDGAIYRSIDPKTEGLNFDNIDDYPEGSKENLPSVHKLPFSAQQIASKQSAMLVAADTDGDGVNDWGADANGYFVMGSTHSTIFGLDARSGAILFVDAGTQSYHEETSKYAGEEFETREIVYVVRKTYHVRAISGTTREQHWNISYSEIDVMPSPREKKNVNMIEGRNGAADSLSSELEFEFDVFVGLDEKKKDQNYLPEISLRDRGVEWKAGDLSWEYAAPSSPVMAYSYDVSMRAVTSRTRLSSVFADHRGSGSNPMGGGHSDHMELRVVGPPGGRGDHQLVVVPPDVPSGEANSVVGKVHVVPQRIGKGGNLLPFLGQPNECAAETKENTATTRALPSQIPAPFPRWELSQRARIGVDRDGVYLTWKTIPAIVIAVLGMIAAIMAGTYKLAKMRMKRKGEQAERSLAGRYTSFIEAALPAASSDSVDAAAKNKEAKKNGLAPLEVEGKIDSANGSVVQIEDGDGDTSDEEKKEEEESEAKAEKTSGIDQATLDQLAELGVMVLPSSASRYGRDFEEIAQLGKGGFGSVFRCRNRLDGHEYAVKRIRLSSAPHWRAKLLKVIREVKVLADLDHQRIVRYHQAWLEENDGDDREIDADAEDYYLYVGENENESSRPESSSRSTPANEYNVNVSSSFNPPHAASPSSSSLMGGGGELGDNMPGMYIFSGMDASESTFGGIGASYSSRPAAARGASSLVGPSPRRAAKPKNPKTVYDIVVYIQMQCCNQRTLRDALDSSDRKVVTVSGSGSGKVASLGDVALAVNVMHQLASGMEYVHRRSLIHRDIKPSNVFLVDDDLEENGSNPWCVKIGDFGLSRQVAVAPSPKSEDMGESAAVSAAPLASAASPAGAFAVKRNKCLPRSGSSTFDMNTKGVGTILYASPEQIEGREYGPAADMFSLGLVFFELLQSKFSTRMERYTLMGGVRRGVFPPGFADAMRALGAVRVLDTLTALVSSRPSARPSASGLVRICNELMGRSTLLGRGVSVGSVDAKDEADARTSAHVLFRIRSKAESGDGKSQRNTFLVDTMDAVRRCAPNARLVQCGISDAVSSSSSGSSSSDLNMNSASSCTEGDRAIVMNMVLDLSDEAGVDASAASVDRRAGELAQSIQSLVAFVETAVRVS